MKRPLFKMRKRNYADSALRVFGKKKAKSNILAPPCAGNKWNFTLLDSNLVKPPCSPSLHVLFSSNYSLVPYIKTTHSFS